MNTQYLETLRGRFGLLVEEERKGRRDGSMIVSAIEDEVRASFHRGMEVGRRTQKDDARAPSFRRAS